MITKIKTKDIHQTIHSLDKKNNIKYYERKNIHKDKKYQKNENDNSNMDTPHQFAIDKVIKKEKSTALDTICRGTCLYKNKVSKQKQKNKLIIKEKNNNYKKVIPKNEIFQNPQQHSRTNSMKRPKVLYNDSSYSKYIGNISHQNKMRFSFLNNLTLDKCC